MDGRQQLTAPWPWHTAAITPVKNAESTQWIIITQTYLVKNILVKSKVFERCCHAEH